MLYCTLFLCPILTIIFTHAAIAEEYEDANSLESSVDIQIDSEKSDSEEVSTKPRPTISSLATTHTAVEENEQPIPMADLEGEPSAFVCGCVNVITGQFYDSCIDLAGTHGVDPLSVERTFLGTTASSGYIAKGWTLNFHDTIQTGSFKHLLPSKIYRATDFILTDDHGGILPFKKNVIGIGAIPNEFFEKGITNTSMGYISAQTNLKKLRVDHGDGFYLLKMPTGGSKKYVKTNKSYSFREEVKPNGNKIIHDHSFGISEVQLKNNQSNTIASLKFVSIDPKKQWKKEVSSSDGRWARYYVTSDNDGDFLQKVERSEGPSIKYCYTLAPTEHGKFGLIHNKELPDQRYLHIDYYFCREVHDVAGSKHYFHDDNDPRHYRVKNLSAPAGIDATPHVIYQFFYELNVGKKRKVLNGNCRVFNGYNQLLSRYDFDENQRLGIIRKYLPSGKEYTCETLAWDQTFLSARMLTGMDGTAVFLRTYAYDPLGNILQDKLYGNLTGANQQPPNIAKPDNGCECYCKMFTYTNDEFNLVTSEYDGFMTTTYSYYEKSNLLKSKFQKGSNQDPCRRWYYFYDDNACLIKEISDDGRSGNIDDLSGVTERFLTYYQRTEYISSSPIGLPKVIEEKCLDLASGKERLIHKTVNTYNKQGRIEEQHHYGNDGASTHKLSWGYDDHGNVTRETDAMGRTTRREYDVHNNCKLEQGPNSDFYKVMSYDFMNRLIKIEEVHSDKHNRTLSHTYDLNGYRTSTTDQNGNITRFEYDLFGRPIQTIYPQVLNEEGKEYSPVIRKEYSLMGHITTLVDPRGAETKKEYTVRGQPASIFYPDGTTEKYTYQLNGFLKSFKAKNGTLTSYTSDMYGRPILTEVFSAEGELLSTTSATYSAYHVLSETDAMGNVTTYTYTPEGKLASKKTGDTLTTYSYDSLGRLNKSCDHLDSKNFIATVKGYDALNRVKEDRIEDSNGIVISKVNYGYDISGNISQLTTYQDGQVNTTTTIYNSHGIPHQIIDAEGYKTITVCLYTYKNALNQYVPYKETTDPLGNITIVIQDALGRIVETIRKDSFGTITQQQAIQYDGSGNRCTLIDTILAKNDKRQVIARQDYNCVNQLVASKEAVGTPEQKQFSILYNTCGQKEKLIKSDGTTLNYTYDPIGRLHTLISSDATVSYRYHYDLNNNTIQIEDTINASSTLRTYDQHNHMKSETLAHGLSLKYNYDNLGRTSKVILPDATGISYNYRASLLETITRVNASERPFYAHKYTRHDQSGNILEATYANNLKMKYTYDALGRLSSTTSKPWTQTLAYDPIGNIIENKVQDDIGNVSSEYDYDALYQLVSENGAATHAYTYDSNYNRLEKDGKVHEHNDLHQLLSNGKDTYTYDANGNLKTKTQGTSTTQYKYDALDRLISIETPAQKVLYTYDAYNRRLTKSLSTKKSKETRKERYLYHGQNEIGACDATGKIVELRVLGHGKGAEIGAAIAMEVQGKIYIPIHDHTGSVTTLLNMKQDVIDTYRYTAFGEELFDESPIPWRFASKRVDAESGFVYFGRRYYDPENGRWITPDPIERDGGPNLYAYVLNNPQTRFDLYGLFSLSDCLHWVVDLIGGFCFSASDGIGNGYNAFSLSWKQECPLPIVRDLFAGIGHFFKTGAFSGYEMEYSGTHSKHDQVYGLDLHPSKEVGFFCGIHNKFEDANAQAESISNLFSNNRVHFLSNATHGFIMDILETVCQKLNIPTNSVRKSVEMVEKMLKDAGDNGRITLFGFSQGGQIIDSLRYHLSPEQLKRIDVVTLGSAKMVSRKGFNSAVNYVSTRDSVPFIADPIGIARSTFSNDIQVQFVQSNAFPFFDHGIMNDSYQRVLMRYSREYINVAQQ